MSFSFKSSQSFDDYSDTKDKSTASLLDSKSRLIFVEIDRIAEIELETIFISLSSNNEFKLIIYRQYVNVIDGIAWWLKKQLDKNNRIESLTWFDAKESDIRYAILLIAAVKAEYYVILSAAHIESRTQLLTLSDTFQFVTKQCERSRESFQASKL